MGNMQLLQKVFSQDILSVFMFPRKCIVQIYSQYTGFLEFLLPRKIEIIELLQKPYNAEIRQICIFSRCNSRKYIDFPEDIFSLIFIGDKYR